MWSSGNHCHIVSAVVSDADEGEQEVVSNSLIYWNINVELDGLL